MNYDHTHILGSKLDLISKQDMRALFRKWMLGHDFNHVITLNPEICLAAEKDDEYHRILKKSALSVDDGIGLQIAAKILGAKMPSRITGREVIDELCQLAVEHKKKLYLLGAKAGVAKKAGKSLSKKYPGLVIAGAEEGIAKSGFSLDSPNLVNRINQSQADILLVAFGAPKQEKWIYHNQNKLKTVRIAVGIGGLLDYLAGKAVQPHPFIQKAGLEWLFRLFTQPRRAGRIFNATAVFLSHVIFWRIRMTFTFRKNVVGAILDKGERLLLVSPAWSKEIKWQFPQGGVDKETPAQAILREMNEELGTNKLVIKKHYPNVHRYVWPKWYKIMRGYRGQKQDLFILEFTGSDKDIDIAREGELSHWQWVKKRDVLNQMAPVRRNIGKIVLDNLEKLT